MSRDPHSRDLRKGRVSIAGQIYSVTTVTAGRAPVFSDLQQGRILVHALRHQHLTGAVDSLAFVVMPDHVHWLFALSEGSSLSQVVGQVKRYSVVVPLGNPRATGNFVVDCVTGDFVSRC